MGASGDCGNGWTLKTFNRRGEKPICAKSFPLWECTSGRGGMAGNVTSSGEPAPTSSVLMAASRHIGSKCRAENIAFLKCKRDDPNPETCLDKGRLVTKCVLHLLRGLHQSCGKELDAYAGCMHYHTNEFEFCRKEQKEFEKACPL